MGNSCADKKGTVIFDGDDTLWKTQELYDLAKRLYEALLLRHGFDKDPIIERLDELDEMRIVEIGLSSSRFIESMLLYYAILCGQHDKEYDLKVELEIRALGSYFQRAPELFDDAVDTLTRLKSYFNLVMFTEGDFEVQDRKIKTFGEDFIRLFYRICIFESNKGLGLSEFLCGKDPKNVWLIGNSIRSDINPAIKLGMNAIYIARSQWRYETNITPISDEYFPVTSLTEAADIILRGELGEK